MITLVTLESTVSQSALKWNAVETATDVPPGVYSHLPLLSPPILLLPLPPLPFCVSLSNTSQWLVQVTK